MERGDSPFKNLLKEITARNLSYKKLAKLMGLSSAAVSHKMRGRINFTDKDIAKLVEIFGKPAEYLLSRDAEG